MPTANTCAKCGVPLGPDARQGFCPKCLFVQVAAGLDDLDAAPGRSDTASDSVSAQRTSGSAPDLRTRAGHRFGDYELLEEVGRGGMGIVYKALQPSVGRHVAVKLLLFGPQASPEFVKRLRLEATSAGCLQHPNIVAIHEVGVHQDQHYLVMDYVGGPNLAALAANQPLPAQRAAGLVKTLAEAIHYAHERGILHRDLKPSNILMDEHGQPRITDFGLAKRLVGTDGLPKPRESEALMGSSLRETRSTPSLTSSAESRDAVESVLTESLTLTGQVLGSPNYMPPEQASSNKRKVGRYSDVYSLGAVLYHLLTGRPPFVGETITATLHQVLETEAASPRLLNPRVPIDLETICLKCLEKEPERRYATARELSDELGRFLKAEPILARPISRLQRLWRWCRRNPVVASLASATLLLLLTVAIGSPIAVYRIDRERKRVEQQSERAEQERRRAVAGEAEAQRLLYAANMNLIQQAWEQSNLSRLQQLLDETRACGDRGFEWYFWKKQLRLAMKSLRGHLGLVNSVAVSPDGRWIASGSADHTAKIWETATGRELLTLRGHTAQVNSVAWFPDGRRLATASEDHTVRIWNATNAQEITVIKSRSGRVEAVAVSPSGKRIAFGNQDGTVTVWEPDGTGEIMAFKGNNHQVFSVAFSPDGQFLATGSADGTARLWAMNGGQAVRTLQGHTDYVRSVAFSPAGYRIVTASDDNSAIVWETATGRRLLTLNGHSDYVRSAAFAPDGRLIVTASDDQTTKLWDAESGRELKIFNAPTDQVRSVCFSHDSRQLVTGSADSVIRLWNFGTDLQNLQFQTGQGPLYSAVFSPDARFIATCGKNDSKAQIWDAATARALRSLGDSDMTRSVAFSPDGRRVATGTQSGAVNIWETSTGEKVTRLAGLPTAVWSIAFSPDGRNLVTGCFNGIVKLWEAATGRELRALMGHADAVPSVAFSPDGRRILTGAWDTKAIVWDAATGRELLSLKGHGNLMSVGFSPEGKRIVTAGADQTAMVWDAESGQELLILRGHSDSISSAAFSPDGTRILTGSYDRTAKLWDARNGSLLLTLKATAASVTSAAFSSDGRKIAVAQTDGTVTQWEPDSGEQVASWENEEDMARQRVAQRQRERQKSLEEQRMARARDPGVIRQWLMLAPIPASAQPLDAEFCSPESQLRPAVGDRARLGELELNWRPVELADGLIDFTAWMGRMTEYSVAYAVCYLEAEAEQSGLRLLVGSDDQSKVYLNGKEVYVSRFKRSFIEDEDMVENIRLDAGKNVLIFKVVNETAHWKGSVRLTDADGNQVKGIRVGLMP